MTVSPPEPEISPEELVEYERLKSQLEGTTPGFWEGPQWNGLGFIIQYLWVFGIVVSVSIICPPGNDSPCVVFWIKFMQGSAILSNMRLGLDPEVYTCGTWRRIEAALSSRLVLFFKSSPRTEDGCGSKPLFLLHPYLLRNLGLNFVVSLLSSFLNWRGFPLASIWLFPRIEILLCTYYF